MVKTRYLGSYVPAFLRWCRYGNNHDWCNYRPSALQRWGKRGDAEEEALGRSKGGYTTKIHALVDALGNPIRICLTGGHRHDVTQAVKLLEGWETERILRVLGDKGYDSDAIIVMIEAMKAEAVIPPKANRVVQREYDKDFYKERHLVECFFNKLKQFRRVFSRFEQLARNYLAFVQFACMLIWLRWKVNTA